MEFKFNYTPEQVLQMLEEVDFLDRKDGKKRRDAYVTERYFEELLTGNFANLDSQISTGWLYRDDWKKKIRHWVLILDRTSYSDEERKANTDVLNALHHTVQKDLSNKHLFHNISYKDEKIIIATLEKKDNSWVQTQPDTHLKDILKIDQLTSALPRLLQPDPKHGGFAAIWLTDMDLIHLRRLLLQRLVMNFALPGSLDVDAIELSGNNLIFHEFKRKTLCPQGHFPLDRIGSFDLSDKLKKCKKMKENSTPPEDKHTQCEQLDGEITPSEDNHKLCEKLEVKITPSELFDFLLKEFGAQRDERSKVFGLDLFHFKMTEFCHRLGIAYRYSIWDSSHCRAHYKDFPALKDLFDPATMKPRNGCRLISGSLKPADSKGFVFTGWGKSGSFNPDELRIQATFDQSKFRTITPVL